MIWRRAGGPRGGIGERSGVESATYAAEAEIEATHWWFAGRRLLFGREIARLGLTSEARILDIGTSTGTNLRLLRELGYRRVTGLDVSAEAIRYCEEKGLGPVRQGDIGALPFAADSFDLILATDIIEHVDDDRQALAEIARVLAPGGAVLITVPTFPALWGLQDRVARHKRRYRLRPLTGLIERSGLLLQRRYYFNYLLFAPIWAARRLIDRFGVTLRSEGDINSPLLNRLLTMVFALDIATAPLLRPPFGVSALVIARRK
jgi:SAM-dependent methyltransferase